MSDQTLTRKDLLECDVLLCRGEGWLSDSIVRLTGGLYSHTAMYLDPDRVFQATEDGIVYKPLDFLKQEKFIDIYRFQKNGHAINPDDFPAGPVAAAAEAIVGEGDGFAFSHLVILALLGSAGQIPLLTPEEKEDLRKYLDRGAGKLFELLDAGKGQMVCSEAVFTAFRRAEPTPRYELAIEGLSAERVAAMWQGGGVPDGASNGVIEALSEMEKGIIEDAGRLLDVLQGHHAATPDAVVPACITPRDIAESPDLEKVGRFSYGDPA